MPFKDREKQLAYQRAHSKKHNRTYKLANKARIALRSANYCLRSRYGITLEDKKRMWEVQKGLCGICENPLSLDLSEVCTDHNHLTGQVRALLHKNCNTVLGYEEKNPGYLANVLAYKKRWDNGDC